MNGMKLIALGTLLAMGLVMGAAEPAVAQTALSSCGNLGKGSYKLTKNLTATGHCWTLTSSFITLDLNGFTITGDGGSADYGIRPAIVINHTGIEIWNGTITNFGQAIRLPNASGVVVERVRALRNTGTGIEVGNNCVLKDNVAAENGIHGLRGGIGCVATGNNGNDNGDIGLTFPGGATIIGNTVRENVGHGISVGNGSTLANNSAFSNGRIGISALSGSTIANNSSYQNDTTGISVGCPSNVVGNTATQNGLTNISFFGGSGCGNSHNVAP